MKIINLTLALTTLLSISLTSCNEVKPEQTSSNPCVSISINTLKLSGPITPAMQTCALNLLTPAIETIIVNSPGGDVDAGRAIGYRIGERPRTVIVEKYCLSSCGNYFIPAASSVILNGDAIIGLHGSPDPQMLSTQKLESHLTLLEENDSVSASSVKRQLKHKQERRVIQLAAEVQFASKFNVPKGWRHYRNLDDKEDGWRKHFEDGTDKDVVMDRFMVVEEA